MDAMRVRSLIAHRREPDRLPKIALPRIRRPWPTATKDTKPTPRKSDVVRHLDARATYCFQSENGTKRLSRSEGIDIAFYKADYCTKPMLLVMPLLPFATRESSDLRFVGRIYRLRMLGLGLGFFCVASVLFQNNAPPVAWVLLVFDGFLWPHVAHRLAMGSANPRAAELRNLQIDSALGGVWIALMKFNLLPSVVLALMLAIDKVNVGGWRLLARSLVGQIAACVLTVALFGLDVEWQTSSFNIIATLPFLVIYSVAISTATYSLGKLVREQNRQLARMNRIDAPTGLLNRSHWQDEAAHELRRCRRGGQTATLMMIDIDRFKMVNDEYGHPVGDEVIRRIATVIHDGIRDIDVCGRYGGDEFGAVLVDTSAAAAFAIANRIRTQVDALRFEHHPGLRCSVSIGLAEATPELQTTRAWVKHADAALYSAKAAGRNCVASRPVPKALLVAS
jgi:diguanylate cyclase